MAEIAREGLDPVAKKMLEDLAMMGKDLDNYEHASQTERGRIAERISRVARRVLVFANQIDHRDERERDEQNNKNLDKKLVKQVDLHKENPWMIQALAGDGAKLFTQLALTAAAPSLAGALNMGANSLSAEGIAMAAQATGVGSQFINQWRSPAYQARVQESQAKIQQNTSHVSSSSQEKIHRRQNYQNALQQVESAEERRFQAAKNAIGG